MTKSKKKVTKNSTQTVKKSTKTGGKKPAKTVKAVKKAFIDIKPVKILNKKNALEFADYLFSEKTDGKTFFTSYVKMCSGNLQDDSFKQPLSCILGEAYMYFVDPKFSESSLQKEVDRHSAEIDKYNQKLYSDNNCNWENEKVEEYKESEELVSLILAKNSTCKKDKLKSLEANLNNLPGTNDDACLVDDSDEYLSRAKVVKRAWLNSIVPYLK